MSTEWNDLKGPQEMAEIKKAETRNAAAKKHIEISIDAKKWNDSSVWNKERRRIYKSFGFKKLKTENEINKSGSKTYYEFTSDTAFEKKSSAEYTMHVKYILGVLRSSISNEEGLKQLLSEIEHFLTEAEAKFGNVTPTLIDTKTRLKNDNSIQLAIGSLFVPIVLPAVVIYLIVHHSKLNRMAKDYAPLVEAYFAKLAEFESKFKSLTNN